MSEPKTILAFSAELQCETPHTLDIDTNGEIVLTCTETGRSLKYAPGTTPEKLKELLAAHKAANEGQITTAAIEAQKEELLSALADEPDKTGDA